MPFGKREKKKYSNPFTFNQDFSMNIDNNEDQKVKQHE